MDDSYTVATETKIYCACVYGIKRNGAFFPVAILTALVRRESIPRNVFTAVAFAGLSEISY